MTPHRFLILPYSLHSSHIPHLMGRIVLDPLNPLGRFIPDPDNDSSGFNPEDIVPTLPGPPIITHDLRAIARAGSSARLRAHLSEYLGVQTGGSAAQSAELRAAVVRRYEMVNHGAVFKRFMAHEAFRGVIEGILEEGRRGEALMVVGFYTAEKAHWVRSRSRGREHGIDVQMPVGPIAGAPVGVDPGVSVSMASTVEYGMEGEMMEEEVFAIAYDVVKKKHALDRTARRWISTTVVLGDAKRAQAGHLAMGMDGDDELEYDSETESSEAEAGYVLDGDARQWESDTGKLLDYIEL